VDVNQPGCGETTGTVALNGADASSFTYTLTNKDTGVVMSQDASKQTIEGLSLPEGRYELVASLGACISEASEFDIVVPVVPEEEPIVATVAAGCDGTGGSFTITNFKDTLIYKLDGVEIADASGSIPASVGVHALEVFNVSGCSSSATVTIVQDVAPVAPVVDVNQPGCGETTGTVALSGADASIFTYTLTNKDTGVVLNLDNSKQITEGLSLPAGRYELVASLGVCSSEAFEFEIVVYPTPPKFSSNIPSQITTSCDEIPEVIQPDLEIEQEDVIFTFEEREISNNDCSQILERIWTVSDRCGNTDSFTQIVNVYCKLEIFNGLSVNGDNFNEKFILKGIECYPGNNVKIFNRWGVLVFEIDDYDNIDKSFKGISEGRVTIKQKEKLPSGTYFYIIKYPLIIDSISNKKEIIEQSGYIYLKD
jgi:hypothetical protein